MRKIMLSLIGGWLLNWCCLSTVLAAPYVISQTENFTLTIAEELRVDEDDMNGESRLIIGKIYEINIPFQGAPSSIELAGETWSFSGVNVELSGTGDYSFEMYCHHCMVCDCYTQAYCHVFNYLGAGGIILPDQPTELYADQHWSAVHGEGFPLLHDASATGWIRDTFSTQQTYSASTGDYDLSMLEVEDFTVQLQCEIADGIWDRDTGDWHNYVFLEYYHWNGSIRIDYEYTQNPIPLPSTLLLFSSGLFGLVMVGRRTYLGSKG